MRFSGIGRKSLVLLTMSLAVASAASIYVNGAPDWASGNEMTSWIQAEDFMLPVAATLTDVRFWDFGFSPTSYQGSIVWRIYGDAGGAPGAILFSGTATPTRTAVGPCGNWSNCYQDDFSVGSILLSGGTTYWLGLHNGPLGTTARMDMYWATTALNATTRGNEDNTPFDIGGWFNNGQEHAFELFDNSAIPEPATWLMLASGLLGVGLLRYRRK